MTSFLILHELTAIVPLFGLWGVFHYTESLPSTLVESELVSQGTEKFSRYFKKKGWIEDDATIDPSTDAGKASSNTGSKIVVEVAAAWAVTKILLPARLIFSVYATPWFAQRAVLPITRLFRR